MPINKGISRKFRMAATNFDGRRENRGRKKNYHQQIISLSLPHTPPYWKKNTLKISMTQQKRVFGRRETLHTQP